uniref:Uncharacterized protein AlNc14C105G6187 n=1 Tax=Albugo laibachii Nc14 TaxID=890382 RepID=F0WHY0_9STRA|nr:conserved hypothetical protein [Albugo laibachii Nc14]|eukprot:CCA20857.1 conserved hypothetical protein [Albugo laibachii Nc14]
MTEYWKSNERYFCKYCDIWLQGDSISVRHHEKSKRHLDRIQEKLKAKRQAKVKSEREDKDLKKQLDEIERTAHARFAEDMKGKSSKYANNKAFTSKPFRRPKTKTFSDGTSSWPLYPVAVPEEKEPVDERKKDDLGVYSVRDQVFLDGKCHEGQIFAQSACQIWVEELEEWRDALVDAAVRHSVPNTSLSLRHYQITYMDPSQNQVITEKEVTADRLRILLPAGTTLEEAEEMIRKAGCGGASDTTESHGPVDESTGMGEWSTVLVREIPDSEVCPPDEKEDVDAEEFDTTSEVSDHISVCESEVLASFVSKGQHIYKGINLQDANHQTTSVEDRQLIESVETNEPVRFKPRKQRRVEGSTTRKTRRLGTLEDS